MAALLSTPIGIILVLIFKRSGQKFHKEDIYLKTLDDNIPKGLLFEVQNRRLIVRAEDRLYVAESKLKKFNLDKFNFKIFFNSMCSWPLSIHACAFLILAC